PYFLERADYVYEHHSQWTNQSFGKKKPSDVFREHILTCFIDDAIGIKLRHDIGIDIVNWECDYPHSDTTWPNAPERLAQSLEGVSDDDVHKMTWANAARDYSFDPFTHRKREDCTVGALRAESPDVDMTLISAGGTPPAEDETRPVTSADILGQLAEAFEAPTSA
ncbi:MAG: amidohydrolase, partial [Actinomycetota bacterium]|nr:amidohydrolase [Actinomycetota bacterium]